MQILLCYYTYNRVATRHTLTFITTRHKVIKAELFSWESYLCAKSSKQCMQRNRHRILQRVRASQEKREHRFWVHEILRRREEKGAYYHMVRELQFDAENTIKLPNSLSDVTAFHRMKYKGGGVI